MRESKKTLIYNIIFDIITSKFDWWWVMFIKNLQIRKYCQKCGFNYNTFKVLFKSITKVSKKERNSYDNKIAYYTLFHYMSDNSTKKYPKLFEFLLKTHNLDLSRITYNEVDKTYKYQYKDKVITFNKISDRINDEELRKELLSNKRLHKCHYRSIEIASRIENSKVVTGFITDGNIKMLHTVVEFNDKNDNTIVVDYINNLHIAKDQYIDLTKFKEISSIEIESVIDDNPIINILDMTYKPYLCFRDEIMADLQRNMHVFDDYLEEFKTINDIDISNKDKEKVLTCSKK